MEKYPTIYLHRGATSVVEFDLTDFDLQGGSVVVSMSARGMDGRPGRVINSWEFRTPEIHEAVFKDEFTATLEVGKKNYEYDVMWHLGEERFPQCAPSPIEVSYTVGGYGNEG